MRSAVSVLLVLALAACTAEPVTTTTTEVTTTTAEPTTTTTRVELRTCPPAPYQIGFLPLGIGGEIDPGEHDPEDPWTSVGGSHSTLIGRTDGTVAIALIRGTLPKIPWPVNEAGETEKQILEVDGIEIAVGRPHPDGTWVAAWAPEPQERCDEHTMVFYPPWNSRDVERTLRSLTRLPG